jgi:glycosyltransferase involved in cell wall biosynthesis
MRVLINAAGSNMGGAVTYLTNVLPQLARLRREGGRDDHFVVIAPTETLSKLAPVLEDECFTAVAYEEPPVQNVKRLLFDQVKVPRLVRRHRIDLLFSANGFGTLVPGCREILLIRNPIYFCRLYEQKLRELGRSTRRIRLRRLMSVLSIRAADRVLFPTRAMLELARPYGGITPGKTNVIHYGFNRETFLREGIPRPEIATAMAAWRREGDRILLGVSAFAIHKNYETLIESLPTVIADGHRIRLVLTLSREKTGDKAEFDAMMRRAEELGLSDVVHLAGHVPYEALQHIYAESDLFVFPSFAESFGHSMVEAMACGLASVAAGMPVNREVLGEAAHYFETFDAQGCGRAISDLLADPGQLAALRRAAEQRARLFSWSDYTRSLLDEFETCLSG